MTGQTGPAAEAASALKASRPSQSHGIEHERVPERRLLEPVVAARRSAVPAGHVDLEVERVRIGLEARSFATHFAGSQYMTCESLSEVVTSIHGYAFASTLSYGE